MAPHWSPESGQPKQMRVDWLRAASGQLAPSCAFRMPPPPQNVLQNRRYNRAQYLPCIAQHFNCLNEFPLWHC
ncbi:hypothetical protein IQ07DRAFT_535798 [Pyrenochaeta sp. DS3sAY3a]|nr:hypothetical protein IQ07DRAFT_535798 [Pyrenochaeta sp. DS3sAY3a]